MNTEDAAQYLWLLIERKGWTQYRMAKREKRYDRFERKLYIPTRMLRFGYHQPKPLTVSLLTSSSARKSKWVSLISARKGWKIANSFSPGWYR